MAKRGSRKPEKASTRPPAKARSSFPQRDPRPPKRGKRAGPPEKPPQSASVATSLSGKPTSVSDLSAIPSSAAPLPKRGRKSKGKVEQPEQRFERRTLTTKEQQEMALRAVRLSVEVRRRERKLKRETKAERDGIKALRAQAEKLEDEAEQGFELVPEGDLFADRRETEAGASTPTVGQTDAALGEIAVHVGGNGYDFKTDGPPPKIDNEEAGPTRIEANRAKDDITRAAKADAAGAHA